VSDQTELNKVLAAVLRMDRHRNIPCSGATKCDNPDCGLISHNHVLFKTKEARDDWGDLMALLQEG